MGKRSSGLSTKYNTRVLHVHISLHQSRKWSIQCSYVLMATSHKNEDSGSKKRETVVLRSLNKLIHGNGSLFFSWNQTRSTSLRMRLRKVQRGNQRLRIATIRFVNSLLFMFNSNHSISTRHLKTMRKALQLTARQQAHALKDGQTCPKTRKRPCGEFLMRPVFLCPPVGTAWLWPCVIWFGVANCKFFCPLFYLYSLKIQGNFSGLNIRWRLLITWSTYLGMICWSDTTSVAGFQPLQTTAQS